jgi:enoyl-CoA hydratase/carnithine racemase
VSEAPLREETRGPARIVTLTRPARKNALDAATADLLATAIERASADPAVRGVVLAAEGDVFLAGGDLQELASLLDRGDGAERVLAMGRRLDAIEAATIPVIAALGGDVYGGGCEVVLACDDAIAEEGVTLTFRHARMGLCPAWGATARLIARVGPLHASRFLLAAEPIDAGTAAAVGLVSEVVSRGGAVAAALARVDSWARADRDVIAAQRRLLRETTAAAASRTLEGQTFHALWGGPAHRAAMQAFARRRG